jgi:quercetin dioxygenase-like cupin family protein
VPAKETALNPYFDTGSQPWEELGKGIRRKILGHTPELMSVLVQFDKGAVGTPHAHDAHDQIAFCLAGAFEAEVGGVKRTLRAGEGFVAARHTMHGVVALEPASVLLDQFSPRRDDYLTPTS